MAFSSWGLQFPCLGTTLFPNNKMLLPLLLFYNRGSKSQNAGESGLDPKPRFKSHSPGGASWGLGEAEEELQSL